MGVGTGGPQGPGPLGLGSAGQFATGVIFTMIH